MTRNGAVETRPRDGLRPKTPQQDAGIRIEPPPSVPCASGTSPAASAAAPLRSSRPGVSSGFHGFRVSPFKLRLGERDRPELRGVRLADDYEAGLADAAGRPRCRSRGRCRRSARRRVRRADARRSAVRSLTAIGTPRNGRVAERDRQRSRSATASSPRTVTKEFSSGSSRSIRPRYSSVELDRGELLRP